MNPGNDGTDGAQAIDLARESGFALAHLAVTPATLTVSAPGWSQRLEPRVMQVLVVLAQRSPAVVGRAELNARVWAGRVVGDDAVNRAVQTLRRMAAEVPQPLPFTIDTVPRVGYRLTAAPTADARVQSPVRPSRRTARGWAAAALVAVAIAALIAWSWSGRSAKAVPWRIVASQTFDDLPPDARDAALSPDGRQLAYRGLDRQGRERVFVRAAAGGGAGVPVSPPGVAARRPAWSPDSARLAFLGFDAGRPCSLHVVAPGGPARHVGDCEVGRDPAIAWSADGRALMFGDAPGWNAVTRIAAVAIADGRRSVLSSPPGDSRGDTLPLARGASVFFQREFGSNDFGWVEHRADTGRERLLWRRRGTAAATAALLPDGSLAIAWTRAGASGLDIVGADGRAVSHPLALGSVTAVTAAGARLLIETDRTETALVRPGDPEPLATMRGRITAPVLLADGRMRFPVTAAGLARVWERDRAGTMRPWGSFVAGRIAGLEASPDGRWAAALAFGDEGREVVVLDARGRAAFRWNPHARSLNPGAWTADGRGLIVPVLDGAGWRLFALDPFGGAAPRDLGLPGFATLIGRGAALYAVRAGETTGNRELWRIDGVPRRLAVDLTLIDIVNWRPTKAGIWLPDRGRAADPRLLLRDEADGRVLRSVAAPGLAGPGAGFAVDAAGPIYVQVTRESSEYGLVTLARR